MPLAEKLQVSRIAIIGAGPSGLAAAKYVSLIPIATYES
jgi:cation diffusion facilitator CzcD-associated flavoprotein CzcO